MEIEFNTNNNIRKLIAVTNLLGRPGFLLKGTGQRFFGKGFYTATEIFSEVCKITQNQEEGSMWAAFLDKNIEDTRKTSHFSTVSNLLETLDIPTEDKASKFFIEMKSALAQDFKSFEGKIATWLVRIFGVNLPRKIDIVLDRNKDKWSSGNSLRSDIGVVIYLQTKRYSKDKLAIILHELLHSLIREKGLIEKKASENNYFEDALLDYFVPNGILDKKIGLIETLDIEKHQKEQEELRPYSLEASRRLLPLIGEYYAICGEKTIWQFLKEKNFDEMASS